MDSKHRAQDIYYRTRREESEPQATQTVLKQIFLQIRDFLLKCPVQRKFTFTEFFKILQASCITSDFDPVKASTAFEKIEFYLILILRYPWKSEYRVLKPYGGFFQTKIQSHLRKTEEIFKLIGYKEYQGNKLMLTKRLNRDVTLTIAFECLIASVECSIISEIQQRFADDFDVRHIVACRLENSGNIDDMVAILKSQHGIAPQSSFDLQDSVRVSRTQKQVHDLQADLVRSDPNSPTEVSRGQINIPFIDEDAAQHDHAGYELGTLDDHLMASLRLVSSTSEKEKRKEVVEYEVKKASDEWSFVHDKLRKDFGESYYQGDRGDVLKDEGVVLEKEDFNQETCERSHIGSKRTSGYVSASQGERNRSLYPTIQSRKTTQDSGFVGGSSHASQQPVFYPPEDVAIGRSRGPGPKANTLPSDPHRHHSSAVAHAELSKNFPGKNSLEKRGSSSMGITPQTRTISPEMSPSNFCGETVDRGHAFREKTNVPHQNFSQSAPILRKTSDRVEYVTATEIQGRFAHPDVNLQEWICPHCTVTNPYSSSYICAVCGKSGYEPGHKNLKVVQPNCEKQKECSACTLLNPMRAVECDACGRPLE